MRKPGGVFVFLGGGAPKLGVGEGGNGGVQRRCEGTGLSLARGNGGNGEGKALQPGDNLKCDGSDGHEPGVALSSNFHQGNPNMTSRSRQYWTAHVVRLCRTTRERRGERCQTPRDAPRSVRSGDPEMSIFLVGESACHPGF